jgi:predicted anti-sigma-YlaC factor YlaD
MDRARPPLAIALVVVVVGGCSLRRLALDQTASILKDSLPAFETEWDFELVESSLPASIKVVEGFLASAPDNRDLLLMAAQAYASYALVVLEDQLERAPEDSPAAAALGLRVREMYLRGHRYGLALLATRHPGIHAAFAGDQAALERALAACAARDVPALFWAGMPLASAVNVARDDVTMLPYLPRAKALVARALELDEKYYHGGAHMIFGALLGSMGKMLGGDPERSRKHFARALEITGRRFLMVQLMYAKTLAVQTQDRNLFRKLLGEVLKAELAIYPEQKLANVAAKRRARRLLAREAELF